MSNFAEDLERIEAICQEEFPNLGVRIHAEGDGNYQVRVDANEAADMVLLQWKHALETPFVAVNHTREETDDPHVKVHRRVTVDPADA